MKKFYLLLLIAGLYCGTSLKAQAASNIVFTWTNPNTAVPSCSTSVTKSCLVGDTITDTTVSGSPVVLSSSIAPTATTYTTPLPSFTTTSRTYTLVVNYKDSSGTAQSTAAVTATVGVPLVVNAPTGWQGVAQ